MRIQTLNFLTSSACKVCAFSNFYSIFLLLSVFSVVVDLRNKIPEFFQIQCCVHHFSVKTTVRIFNYWTNQINFSFIIIVIRLSLAFLVIWWSYCNECFFTMTNKIVLLHFLNFPSLEKLFSIDLEIILFNWKYLFSVDDNLLFNW